MTRVVHVTPYHPATDVRVFQKECRTLAKAGYEVHLMIPNPPTEVMDGVRFHAIQRPRFSHFSYFFWAILPALYRIYRAAKSLDGDIYHFHDAELVMVGWALKFLHGKKIIFDSHEDFPRQVLYVNDGRLHRFLFARFMCFFLTILMVLTRVTFDGFVATSPKIAERYPKKKTVHVYNYARVDEYPEAPFEDSPYSQRPKQVLYVGGINQWRGGAESVRAMSLLPDAHYIVIGKFSTPEVQQKTESQPGWEHVEHLGWQGRETIMRQMLQARAGLLPFLDQPHHRVLIPNKMFEYMGGGLPVISTEFPHWRKLLGEYADCVYWIKVATPESIAAAIREVFDHPDEAEARGRRGRMAVEKRFNWDHETPKLLGLYQRLTPKSD